MKRLLTLAALLAGPGATLLAPRPAWAVDHDNMDAGHPLDFDDAETIAFREQSVDLGGAVAWPRGSSAGLVGTIEYQNGFQKNWQLNLGATPGYRSGPGHSRQFDAGDVTLGVQHNFNRESEASPAYGIRFDAALPSGRDSRGTGFRIRAIASRKLGDYGRLHLNADLNLSTEARAGDNKTQPGVILGYSRPLGYPRRFDRTILAQLSYRRAPTAGDTALLDAGIGLRQQITPRGVLDIGLKTDLSGNAPDRQNLQLIAGYSAAF